MNEWSTDIAPQTGNFIGRLSDFWLHITWSAIAALATVFLTAHLDGAAATTRPPSAARGAPASDHRAGAARRAPSSRAAGTDN